MTSCIPTMRMPKTVKEDKQVTFSTTTKPSTGLLTVSYNHRYSNRAIQTQCLHGSETSAVLSKEQLEFLERKEKGILPRASACDSCDGIGTVPCVSCNGTGINPEGLADRMFTDERGVRQNNNIIDARWLFADNGPCWLCKGALVVACKECSGVGIPGILDKYSGD